MNRIVHYDHGGQVYVTEHPRAKARLARPGEDLDALLTKGAIVTRLPIKDPPEVVSEHAEGEECFLCDQEKRDARIPSGESR